VLVLRSAQICADMVRSQPEFACGIMVVKINSEGNLYLLGWWPLTMIWDLSI